MSEVVRKPRRRGVPLWPMAVVAGAAVTVGILAPAVLTTLSWGNIGGGPMPTTGAATPTPALSDDGIEGSWRLVDGTSDGVPIPLVDDAPITMTIAGTQISGRASCNGYGARVEFRDGRAVIGGIGATDVLCPEPQMAAEAAYMGALPRVTQSAREGETLVLRGPGMEMRFVLLPAPPTAELVDVTWVLESLFVGNAAAPPEGEPATLTLRSDGTFDGSTGCRLFTGNWIESGEQILAPSWGMDGSECPPALSAQDSHVVSVIGDGFVPSIEGDLLTLIDPGRVGLVYRASE